MPVAQAQIYFHNYRTVKLVKFMCQCLLKLCLDVPAFQLLFTSILNICTIYSCRVTNAPLHTT